MVGGNPRLNSIIGMARQSEGFLRIVARATVA